MDNLKYIKTYDGEIIVFPPTMKHSQFKHFNPVSAGFIRFRINEHNEMECECAGESISLNLKSGPADWEIATRQMLKSY